MHFESQFRSRIANLERQGRPLRGFVLWDIDGTAFGVRGIPLESCPEITKENANDFMAIQANTGEYLPQIVAPVGLKSTIATLEQSGFPSVAYLTRRDEKSSLKINHAYTTHFGIPDLLVLSLFGSQTRKKETLKLLEPLCLGLLLVLIDNTQAEIDDLPDGSSRGVLFNTDFEQVIQEFNKLPL